jgi:hypothetical protein
VKRARDRKLAMPLCPPLLGPGCLENHGLIPLAEQPPLLEQLWLLLPQEAVSSRAARQCLRLLRGQVGKAAPMPNPHGNQG